MPRRARAGAREGPGARLLRGLELIRKVDVLPRHPPQPLDADPAPRRAALSAAARLARCSGGGSSHGGAGVHSRDMGRGTSREGGGVHSRDMGRGNSRDMGRGTSRGGGGGGGGESLFPRGQICAVQRGPLWGRVQPRQPAVTADVSRNALQSCATLPGQTTPGARADADGRWGVPRAAPHGGAAPASVPALPARATPRPPPPPAPRAAKSAARRRGERRGERSGRADRKALLVVVGDHVRNVLAREALLTFGDKVSRPARGAPRLRWPRIGAGRPASCFAGWRKAWAPTLKLESASISSTSTLPSSPTTTPALSAPCLRSQLMALERVTRRPDQRGVASSDPRTGAL